MSNARAVPSRHDELTIDARGAEVRRASAWLVMACRRHDVPRALAGRLELCLNEVLENIITHGGTTVLSAPIRLLLEVAQDQVGNNARVTVSDTGMPFNPLLAPQRVLPKTLAEAPEGGLGLVMIRRFADWLDYRHEDGQNHLTFATRWNLQ